MDVPTWATFVITFGAVATAAWAVWRKVVVPLSTLVVWAKQATPILATLVDVFGNGAGDLLQHLKDSREREVRLQDVEQEVDDDGD